MRLDFERASASHPAAKRGAAAALREFTLDVAAGEQLAIIGPSGAGKTTLLHVAAAALKPEDGALRIDGRAPWALPGPALRALRGRLFLAPQAPPLPPRQRVVTAVLAGRLPAMTLWASLKSLVHPQDIAAAHAALARFDIEDKVFDRVDRLSGGERQRVGLARAFVSPSTLWLIDEPLSALDPTRARQAIGAIVTGARERGVTLVATLHQVDVALERFARIVGLRDGMKVFDLPSAKVTPGMLSDLYGDEYARLQEPAAPPDESAPATTPLPNVMSCR